MSEDYLQFELPPFQSGQSNIEDVNGISVLTRGEFKSPNFSAGVSGWKLDSRGRVEAVDLVALSARMKNSTITLSAVVGEPLTVSPRKALYCEDSSTTDKTVVSQTTYTDNPNNGQSFGVSATTKVAQSFIEGGVIISKIKVRLCQVGAVTDNVKVGIQADNNNAPSGTFLASATTTGNTLPTDPAASEERTITLSADVVCSKNTKYWIVAERTGSTSESNYYKMFLSTGNTNPYTNGGSAAYNGSSWSIDASNDYYFKLITTTIQGKVYLASALSTATANSFIGFNDEVYGGNDNGVILSSGIIDGFSGLTKGATYYLSDTYGAISTSAGTVSKKVGVAYSDTQLLLQIS